MIGSALIKDRFKISFNGDEEDVVYFEEGLEVEILKIIESTMFDSGKGYVIFNKECNESVTVDEGWLILLK